MNIKEPLKNTHTFVINGIIISTKSVKDAIDIYNHNFTGRIVEHVLMDGEEIELD